MPYEHCSPYAATKAAAERIASAAGAVVLRPGCVWGAGQSQQGPAPNVLASFARQATKGRVVVDGTGHQTRDFVHVDDVADLFAVAATAPHRPLFPVDVCTGQQTRIVDLAHRFGVPVVHGPSRNDPFSVPQDPHQAVAAYGWRSRITLDDRFHEVWWQ